MTVVGGYARIILVIIRIGFAYVLIVMINKQKGRRINELDQSNNRTIAVYRSNGWNRNINGNAWCI